MVYSRAPCIHSYISASTLKTLTHQPYKHVSILTALKITQVNDRRLISIKNKKNLGSLFTSNLGTALPKNSVAGVRG